MTTTGSLERDWVKCPICGEDDMRKEDGIIRCTNLNCGSNGGTNFNGTFTSCAGNQSLGREVMFRIGIVTVDDPDFKRELDQFLEGVTGVVVANSYEYFALWSEYKDLKRGEWKQNLSGLGCGIGELAGMPVTVSLTTAVVEGFKLLFIHAMSQVVDHRMVREWLDANMPDSAKFATGRLNITDAQNFYNVLVRPTRPEKVA